MSIIRRVAALGAALWLGSGAAMAQSDVTLRLASFAGPFGEALQKYPADLGQPLGQAVGDLRSRSNRVAGGEFAPGGDGPFGAGRIPHHEIFPGLHPFPVHFFTSSSKNALCA